MINKLSGYMSETALKSQLAKRKEIKDLKKQMTCKAITYYVDFKGLNFCIIVQPLGKGFYEVDCVLKENGGELGRFTLGEQFTHQLSISWAHDTTLKFYNHFISQTK